MPGACGGLAGTGRNHRNGLMWQRYTMNPWQWLKRKCSSTIAFLRCSLVLLVIQSQYNFTSYISIKINLSLFLTTLSRCALFTSHTTPSLFITLSILCLCTWFSVSPFFQSFLCILGSIKMVKKDFNLTTTISHKHKKCQVNTKGGGDANAWRWCTKAA